MSTDRELMELAAKAYADPNIIKGGYPYFTRWIGRNEDLGCDVFVNWNPLTDDGDALRLAVKLKLLILQAPNGDIVVDHYSYAEAIDEPREPDAYAATRRAIVRVAAEIGKAMP